ncbi:hypothetical protein CK203_045947 [Vitis vinifera]|uniref:Retrotransposon gag domain-containing protein n=1 Tax=Vitis vinifera TaxID=29760 RepID=A0A438I4Z2_VITVI|nr:hypothetical protein CK203_045947 [Vitis vinifera]
MCGGDFMSKNPEEAMDFLSYVDEVSRGWNEPHRGEVRKMKSQPNALHAKARMYTLNEDVDMKAKFAAMTRRLEESSKFSWKPRVSQYQQPAQPSQQASSLEQAIVNLSKVVGDFVGDQKSINSQLSQRIDSVENTLNKMMDGMQNDLSQKIDNLQYSISRLTNLNTVQEKGRFPFQPHQNPKGIHEVELMRENLHRRKKKRQRRGGNERNKKDISEEKEDRDSTVNANTEKELIKEELMKKRTSPPFPQALHGKKGIKNASEILEVLRQVKVNIPLLDVIKQVPSCCKVPKGPVYDWRKGSGKSLLDLGASVNLLPYSVYKQMGLGKLKPTSITLSLADRNGLMQLTFGNMTLELNIFHMSKKLITPEEEEGPEEYALLTL